MLHRQLDVLWYEEIIYLCDLAQVLMWIPWMYNYMCMLESKVLFIETFSILCAIFLANTFLYGKSSWAAEPGVYLIFSSSVLK